MKHLNRYICVLLIAMVAISAMAVTTPLPFIQDDYGKALAEAKWQHLPIFVECWAPW
ncbi:MAG TPA: hypothetical protein VFQ00_12870 [Terriglobales bacterium]|nr:hypothetical protein [Terriglobales bacterium]